MNNPLTEDELIALKAWMKDEGLSARKAAPLLGVNQVTLSRWLHGWGIHPAHRVLVFKAIQSPAAAPDLITAAKAVVERWDSPLWSRHVHTAELIDALRKAIAKAEGGGG